MLLTPMVMTGTIPERILYQLYGEWSVWHSSLPHFVGPNKIMVNLYPHNSLEVQLKQYVGPCLYEKKWIGNFHLVDIDKCRIENVPEDFQSVCSCNVNIVFTEMIHSMISVFGIGVDEIPIPIKKTRRSNISMELNIVGRDDLYLTVFNHELQDFLSRPLSSEKKTSYHLIRSIYNDQPRVNVPFSTFIVTQLLGTLIGYWLHLEMCHSP